MRVLIVGAAGMLGRDATAVFGAAHEVIAADRAEGYPPIDITDPESVRAALRSAAPDAVLNCAAFTDVEGATRDPDAAHRVNAWGTWLLARGCAERGVPLCHLSTDFVFDGTKDTPYTEFDAPNPINAYGASKYAGEQALPWARGPQWLVRTQWLYGAHGRCFPETMLRLARERDAIEVVDDQVGCPTWTVDLARMLLAIMEGCPPGVYHVNNAGPCSWYEFARAVLEEAGEDPGKIRPIPSSAYPSPTRRPAHAPLRRYSLELQGKDTARPWRDALRDYLASRSHPLDNPR